MMQTANETRDRLYVFYEKYNPQNTCNVEQILREFAGREGELWSQLSHKYGPNAVRDAANEHRLRVESGRRRHHRVGFGPRPVALPPRPAGFSTMPDGGFSSSAGFSSRTTGFSSERPTSFDLSDSTPQAEVVTEISARIAMPSREVVDADMAAREAAQKTSTHEAVCAWRALQALSAQGKGRVRDCGGLLRVVEAYQPYLMALGGPNKKATETFVLVDKTLVAEIRAALNLRRGKPAQPTIDSRLREILRTLHRTKAWAAALSEAAALVDAACVDEEAALRGILARVKDDPVSSIRDLSERVAASQKKKKEEVDDDKPRPDVYGRGATCGLLFGIIQACRPDAIGSRDGPKPLSPAERRPTLAHLQILLRTAINLAGMTQRQRTRLTYFLQVVKDHLSQPDVEVQQQHQQQQQQQQQQDFVIVEAPPAAARPNEVVDLTSEGGLDGSGSRPPKAVRFVDDEATRSKEADRDSILAEARTKGREGNVWIENQRTVLGKRMDRAIWEAFKVADFDPVLSLLDQGASASYVRDQAGGETALMAAAYHGNDVACRALLSKGADAAARDKFGHTAANLARQKQFPHLATLLEGLSDENKKRKINDAVAVPAAPDSPQRAPKRRRGDDQHPRSMPTAVEQDDDVPANAPTVLQESSICTQPALDESAPQ